MDNEVIVVIPELKSIFFNKINEEIYNTIQKLSIKLTNKIKSDKLTGQVLKVRSGRLRNSIQSHVEKNDTEIKGIVSTDVKYAGVHEYGFQGQVTVKAHLRQIKQAFGKQIAPKSIQIGTYTRNVLFPERSFMRTALADMKDEINTEIKRVVGQ